MSVTEFSSLLGHFSTRAGAAVHIPRPDKQQAARASLRTFEMHVRVRRHTNSLCFQSLLKNSRCDNPGFLIKTIFWMTSASLRFGLEQGLGKT